MVGFHGAKAWQTQPALWQSEHHAYNRKSGTAYCAKRNKLHAKLGMLVIGDKAVTSRKELAGTCRFILMVLLGDQSSSR